MSNAKAALSRLIEKITVLESVSGVCPDYEFIRQRDDGSWPEPQTDAPLLIMGTNFKARRLLRQASDTVPALHEMPAKQAEINTPRAGLQNRTNCYRKNVPPRARSTN